MMRIFGKAKEQIQTGWGPLAEQKFMTEQRNVMSILLKLQFQATDDRWERLPAGKGSWD